MATTASSSSTSIMDAPRSILAGSATRLVSVDVLRGVVMVIMALDHARDFMSNIPFAPENLDRTFGFLFFTRFITHFCAPVFAFLAGTGAFLATSRGKSIQQVSWFFLTRGLWLVLLEVTIVDFGWAFVPWAGAIVIWALGWSMVAMAVIVRLPVRWVGIFGVTMIATHNLLDRVSPASFGRFSWVWTLLHVPGVIPITSNFTFIVPYVLIPWMGVMAAGFAFGKVLTRPDRRKWMTILGVSITALFFVLRGFNLYGNGVAGFPISSGHWSLQRTFSLTLISFFNTEKYPPSLDFLLMTLGPALIFLALIDGVKAERGWSRIFLVYGRVPLFYYVLHIYLLHIIAIVAALVSHQPAAWLWHGGFFLQRTPEGYGHGLGFVYAMWLLAVTLLYLPCRWFMELKQRHRDWAWLSYL